MNDCACWEFTPNKTITSYSEPVYWPCGLFQTGVFGASHTSPSLLLPLSQLVGAEISFAGSCSSSIISIDSAKVIAEKPISGKRLLPRSKYYKFCIIYWGNVLFGRPKPHKVQFLEWPLEGGSQREATPTEPQMNIPNFLAKINILCTKSGFGLRLWRNCLARDKVSVIRNFFGPHVQDYCR